jgi:hypothetical protein
LGNDKRAGKIFLKRQTDEKKLIAEEVEGLIEHKGNIYEFAYQLTLSLRLSL